MSTPPPPVPEIPPTVGPFTISAQLGEERVDGATLITLLEARDPRGRLVELAILTGGAGVDAAAKDRFLAAAERRFRAEPNAILGASSDGPYAWVAMPLGRGAMESGALARAIHAPAAVGARGPQFDPYYRGQRVTPGWHDGLAHWSQDGQGRRWWQYWWLLALFIASLALMLLLLSRCVPPPSGGSPTSGPPTSGSTTSGSTTSGSPSSSPSSSSSSGSASPTPSTSGSPSSGSSSPSSSGSGSGSGSGTGSPSPTNKA